MVSQIQGRIRSVPLLRHLQRATRRYNPCQSQRRIDRPPIFMPSPCLWIVYGSEPLSSRLSFSIILPLRRTIHELCFSEKLTRPTTPTLHSNLAFVFAVNYSDRLREQSRSTFFTASLRPTNNFFRKRERQIQVLQVQSLTSHS